MLTWFIDIGGKYHLEHASTILCKLPIDSYSLVQLTNNVNSVCISVLLVATVYVIYFHGPILRKRSPFAQQLMDRRAEIQSDLREQGSRIQSAAASRANSRRNSGV